MKMEHQQDDDRASLRYSYSLEVLTEELSTSCQPFQLTGKAKAVMTHNVIPQCEHNCDRCRGESGALATALGLFKALENNSVFHLFISI